MNCLDALRHKEFRWLVLYLRDTENTASSVKAIPRDVITDADLLQGYLELLGRENYLKLHKTAIHTGRLEIDGIYVNKTIHVLAREAADHEAAAERQATPEN
ncbi:MAG TPA: hypothetical protein VL486_11700 [Verrucomicrobiae bacterium]|nr:hypothetical protein [Verrucomicrobiae bacterium]